MDATVDVPVETDRSAGEMDILEATKALTYVMYSIVSYSSVKSSRLDK
jgi:hypothetical protein